MSRPEDRLFNKHPFKHYRRTYARAEVRWGAAILAGLTAIAAWVFWKGQNPDPTLIPDEVPSLPRRGEVVERSLAAAGQGGALGVDSEGPAPDKASRGPLPDDLAPSGFSEKNLATFTPENLYVKINGRAGYYKSYGFEELVFVTLEHNEDASQVIDVEAYRLSDSKNALGAFAGEAGESAKTEVLVTGGLLRLDQNALYIARGQHYVRLIGSDASPATQSVLKTMSEKLKGALTGDELPWSYALFGKLGASPAQIAVVPENAFSFGFAKDVHKAGLGDDLEVFAVRTASANDARALAKKFHDGFLSLGDDDGGFAKDQFLGLYSGASASKSTVVGVKGAATLKEAKAKMAELASLTAALKPAANATESRADDEGGYDEE